MLVRCFRALYTVHAGDGVTMRHWLRATHAVPGGVPHLLLVGDGRLADVVAYLEGRVDAPAQGGRTLSDCGLHPGCRRPASQHRVTPRSGIGETEQNQYPGL